MRMSSTPSRLTSLATAAPWLNAAAKPLAACPSEGIPAASPPPTDSAASPVVIVASGLLIRRSSESVLATSIDNLSLQRYLWRESRCRAVNHRGSGDDLSPAGRQGWVRPMAHGRQGRGDIEGDPHDITSLRPWLRPGPVGLAELDLAGPAVSGRPRHAHGRTRSAGTGRGRCVRSAPRWPGPRRGRGRVP